jgi:beta-N-acetylhexosaminidase
MRYTVMIGLLFSISLAQSSAELPIGHLMLLAFEGSQAPLEQLSEFQPAGFLFYRNNLPSTETARATTQSLQQAAAYPLLFGIDQEGGPFNAYRVDDATLFPGQMALAATRDPALARDVAEAIGQELRYMGFNLIFAPIVDVNSNPDNPIIGMRSFGADVPMVSTLGQAYMAGLEQAGMASVAKHFPGHGDTEVDSHLGLPKVSGDTDRLNRIELPPFKAMIDTGVPAIMTAHVIFSELDDHFPATLSAPVVTHLLREQLGFEGLVVTDFMDMKAITDHFDLGEAAVQSIVAGVDLLLLGPNLENQRKVYAALQEASRSGRLSEVRVREALDHSQAVATRYPAVSNTVLSDTVLSNTAIVNQKPDYTRHQILAQKVATQAVTLLQNDGVLPLKADQRVLVLAPRLMQFGEPPLLGDVLARYHTHVTHQRISPDPSQDEIQQALESAVSSDVIILGSYHWQDSFSESLVKLESALATTGKPLIIVALGNPDDLRFFTHPPNAYLAVYGFWEANVRAACLVLTGQVLPQGKLPVSVGIIPLGSGMAGF